MIQFRKRLVHQVIVLIQQAVRCMRKLMNRYPFQGKKDQPVKEGFSNARYPLNRMTLSPGRVNVLPDRRMVRFADLPLGING